jgi:hypothetical protein
MYNATTIRQKIRSFSFMPRMLTAQLALLSTCKVHRGSRYSMAKKKLRLAGE